MIPEGEERIFIVVITVFTRHVIITNAEYFNDIGLLFFGQSLVVKSIMLAILNGDCCMAKDTAMTQHM